MVKYLKRIKQNGVSIRIWLKDKPKKKPKRIIQTKLNWFPIHKKDLTRLRLGLIKKPKNTKKWLKEDVKKHTIEIGD